MANLRTAIDSAFWDQPVSTPQTLEGSARSVPGEPFPLDASRASRALRIQQLSLLGHGFPLGVIPSYSPTRNHGSLAFQSAFLKLSVSDWWLGLVGQFRPKKLISSIRKEFFNGGELELPAFRNVAKHVLDKSLYSLGFYSQFSPSPSSSVLLSTERHGDKKRPRYKMMLFHKLPNHDVTLEAGFPELFVDRKGGYWDVPESISLDMASLPNESGFLYRFGIHKNGGQPHDAVNTVNGEVPSSLMPGLCGKAACSYEKSKDFWRVKDAKEDTAIMTDKGPVWTPPPYDVRLKEPHSAISGIIGATCAAWLGGGDDSSASSRKRSPVSADLFGSVCYTLQHGKFRKDYGDLTRLDARLDICSASALAKEVFNVFRKSESNPDHHDLLSSPRLSCIFQQQIAGPIVARVDSRFALGSPSSGKDRTAHLEDVIYSLSYSLRLLKSGKVVAWYSPKRKEGMIELRLFEF
ncbi:unnamed protein product [Linum trigynum]|uniref:Protein TRIGALACTOSYLDIACYLGLYCEROL 4, chloroplastic n=1 Tax=Linum trigynum TaxID=586398 RepID=A0AAV2EYP5_9ROSI